MIAKNGGVKTAQMLIEKAMRTENPSDGYTTLLNMLQLLILVEAIQDIYLFEIRNI